MMPNSYGIHCSFQATDEGILLLHKYLQEQRLWKPPLFLTYTEPLYSLRGTFEDDSDFHDLLFLLKDHAAIHEFKGEFRENNNKKKTYFLKDQKWFYKFEHPAQPEPRAVSNNYYEEYLSVAFDPQLTDPVHITLPLLNNKSTFTVSRSSLPFLIQEEFYAAHAEVAGEFKSVCYLCQHRLRCLTARQKQCSFSPITSKKAP